MYQIVDQYFYGSQPISPRSILNLLHNGLIYLPEINFKLKVGIMLVILLSLPQEYDRIKKHSKRSYNLFKFLPSSFVPRLLVRYLFILYKKFAQIN